MPDPRRSTRLLALGSFACLLIVTFALAPVPSYEQPDALAEVPPARLVAAPPIWWPLVLDGTERGELAAPRPLPTQATATATVTAAATTSLTPPPPTAPPPTVFPNLACPWPTDPLPTPTPRPSPRARRWVTARSHRRRDWRSATRRTSPASGPIAGR